MFCTGMDSQQKQAIFDNKATNNSVLQKQTFSLFLPFSYGSKSISFQFLLLYPLETRLRVQFVQNLSVLNLVSKYGNFVV